MEKRDLKDLLIAVIKKGDKFMEPKYPHIEVELVGHDGNAFAILGKVERELKRGGVSKEEIDDFLAEAMSADYDGLLRTCMNWVEVC